MPLFIIGRAQNRRRMHRRSHERGPPMLHEITALFRQPVSPPENRLRRRRSQADYDFGLDHRHLRLEPRMARVYFRRFRFFMNAPLSALLELEMLDRIRHVHLRAVDARLLQRAVEQLAGGSDEWMSLLVLLIAGLLADED